MLAALNRPRWAATEIENTGERSRPPAEPSSPRGVSRAIAVAAANPPAPRIAGLDARTRSRIRQRSHGRRGCSAVGAGVARAGRTGPTPTRTGCGGNAFRSERGSGRIGTPQKIPDPAAAVAEKGSAMWFVGGRNRHPAARPWAGPRLGPRVRRPHDPRSARWVKRPVGCDRLSRPRRALGHHLAREPGSGGPRGSASAPAGGGTGGGFRYDVASLRPPGARSSAALRPSRPALAGRTGADPVFVGITSPARRASVGFGPRVP